MDKILKLFILLFLINLLLMLFLIDLHLKRMKQSICQKSQSTYNQLINPIFFNISLATFRLSANLFPGNHRIVLKS